MSYESNQKDRTQTDLGLVLSGPVCPPRLPLAVDKWEATSVSY